MQDEKKDSVLVEFASDGTQVWWGALYLQGAVLDGAVVESRPDGDLRVDSQPPAGALGRVAIWAAASF